MTSLETLERGNFVVIFGQANSGKTVCLRHIVKANRRMKFIVLDINENLGALAEKKRVAVIPTVPEETEHIDVVVQKVEKLGDCFVVLDEVDQYPLHPMHPSLLKNVIRRGRNKGIGFVVACRRPAFMKGLFLANVSSFVVFRHQLPEDLKFLAEFTQEQDENVFRDLKEHHFRLYHNGHFEGDYIIAL